MTYCFLLLPAQLRMVYRVDAAKNGEEPVAAKRRKISEFTFPATRSDDGPLKFAANVLLLSSNASSERAPWTKSRRCCQLWRVLVLPLDVTERRNSNSGP